MLAESHRPAHAVVNVLSENDRTRIWNCIASYEVVAALFVSVTDIISFPPLTVQLFQVRIHESFHHLAVFRNSA
jgi:uncharacterized membrane protein